MAAKETDTTPIAKTTYCRFMVYTTILLRCVRNPMPAIAKRDEVGQSCFLNARNSEIFTQATLNESVLAQRSYKRIITPANEVCRGKNDY